MKYIKAVLCLELLCFLSVSKVMALVPIDRDFKIMPTATPIPTIDIQYKPVKEIDVQFNLISTATPTPKQEVIIQVVTATPEPSKKVEITPTIAQNPTLEPSQEPTITLEVVKKATEEAENTKDLSNWFWQITAGLLLLIIVILIWPKKKKIISDN